MNESLTIKDLIAISRGPYLALIPAVFFSSHGAEL